MCGWKKGNVYCGKEYYSVLLRGYVPILKALYRKSPKIIDHFGIVRPFFFFAKEVFDKH